MASYVAEKKRAVAMSNPYLEKPDASLRAFTIRHLGKGYDAEFLDSFKRLPCYKDLSRTQDEDRVMLGISYERSSAAIVLSILPRSSVLYMSQKEEEYKVEAFAAPVVLEEPFCHPCHPKR